MHSSGKRFICRVAIQLLFSVGFSGLVCGQVSVVAGSVATSKNNYTVGLGKNRLMVVSVTGESLAVGNITGITWGGQALTLARTQLSASGVLRTSVWYLNEAGIAAARGSCNYNFIVTWSSVPLIEVFTAITLKNVNQTTPISGVNSATNADGTTVSTGNTAVTVNGLMFYASASNNDRTHTPPATYTEQSDLIVGGLGGASMATATRSITVAGNENPTATWAVLNSALTTVGVGINGVADSDTEIYYSRNATSGGHWDDPASWTLNSDGTGGPLPSGVWPTRTDHVVIRPGHTIVINATDDNKRCGISPDGLAQPNIGPFVSSNVPMFYHVGDITIGGTLTVTGIEMMIGGYTQVLSGGAFSLGSNLVQVGYFQADAGSTFSSLDDLILTGSSVTLINTNSTSTDDLIIDHTNATLCGVGTSTLQNGSGSQITYANLGNINQICTSFTINCTGVGCTGFPVFGIAAVVSGNTGPAGIGNSIDNSLWLRAGAGTSSTVNGTAINFWNDQSGNANHATQATVAQRPLYQSSVINGQPTVLFDNAATPNNDEMIINDNDNLDNTNGLTIYAVTRPLNLGPDARTILSKRTSVGSNQAYSVFYFTGNNLYIDIDGNTNRFNTPTAFSINTNYIHSVWYDGTLTAAQRVRVFTNGTLEITATESSSAIPNYASGLTLGSINLTDGRPFGGHIAEVFLYRKAINESQRIIVDNYLSAKYNIAIANDFYTMDNVANGNFDFEVAGIGQASDGSKHIDAKGSGAVRMWNPSGLGNGEFLIWGHNGLALSGGNTSVDGTIIQERLNRVWRVSETGDVGNVSVSVDLAGTLGSALGNNLRLLIDRDGDGFADNDVTPIAGSFSGTTITFSGVNFQNGDRFTIGNTNLALPLPIELISFDAEVIAHEVKLKWSTASELNNDYFTIQRSQGGEVWESVVQVSGAGNSTTVRHYETTDGLPYAGVSYYRLKQTDLDGRYSYSSVKRVEVNPVYQLKAFPNPSKEKFSITTGFELQREDVRLLNLLGQELPIAFEQAGPYYTISPRTPAPGVYILQVRKGFWGQSLRILIE
ncbi:MAG: hypothetical protein KF856_20015 [Cyclobacteriaceae bacterium]|nr:hypothetical protein [Cyclobacteriaceae bacterium]